MKRNQDIQNELKELGANTLLELKKKGHSQVSFDAQGAKSRFQSKHSKSKPASWMRYGVAAALIGLAFFLTIPNAEEVPMSEVVLDVELNHEEVAYFMEMEGMTDLDIVDFVELEEIDAEEEEMLEILEEDQLDLELMLYE